MSRSRNTSNKARELVFLLTFIALPVFLAQRPSVSSAQSPEWDEAVRVYEDRYHQRPELPVPETVHRGSIWTERGLSVRGVMRWPAAPYVEATPNALTHEYLHYLIHRLQPEATWAAADGWVDRTYSGE